MFKRLTTRPKQRTVADLSLWEARQREWAKAATPADLSRALAAVGTAKFPATIAGAKQRELRRRILQAESNRRAVSAGFAYKYGWRANSSK